MKMNTIKFTKTPRGTINQVATLSYDEEAKRYKVSCYHYMGGFSVKEQYFKMADHPIDLLEPGDIITFKDDEDIYRIIQVPSEKWNFKNFYLAKNYDGETEDIFVEYEYMKENIERILLKEKFLEESFLVGEGIVEVKGCE